MLIKSESGVDDAFGVVKNPYGADIDVLFFDHAPKPADGNLQKKNLPKAVSLPEAIKKKYVRVYVDPQKKFVRNYKDGRCEEYHCVGYDHKGSHWEVWPKAQVITLKADFPPFPPSGHKNANT